MMVYPADSDEGAHLRQQAARRFDRVEQKGSPRCRAISTMCSADWRWASSSRARAWRRSAGAGCDNSFLILGVLSLLLIGGLVLTYRSVSKEMALARLKSDFVSNVSHELRTPLALDPVVRGDARVGAHQDPGQGTRSTTASFARRASG